MFRKILMFLFALVIGANASVAYATHSWGGYHWARTANPFTLKLGDNVSSAWDSYLGTTSTDWSKSDVLDTTIVSGLGGRNCKAQSGRVEVCSRKYGNNGWLGIASIWASGSHITQGTVKMNDTYFNTKTYNKPEWRNLVMCQEVGHIFGLDHQDEIFNNANLGTCMDYTNNPNSNQHPNAHDYEELESIYEHTDSFTTVSATKAAGASVLAQNGDFENASEWGKAIRYSSDGKPSLYVRDLGNKQKVFTFVIWAKE
jgi:hypothetical protein